MLLFNQILMNKKYIVGHIFQMGMNTLLCKLILGLESSYSGEIKINNFDFFDAPGGIFVTVHKSVGPNGWGHVGHFIQSICLAAVGKGLGTCLQEAWAGFPKLLKKHLEYGDDEILWCGISLGYEDQEHPANSFRTEREQFDSFAKLLK